MRAGNGRGWCLTEGVSWLGDPAGHTLRFDRELYGESERVCRNGLMTEGVVIAASQGAALYCL